METSLIVILVISGILFVVALIKGSVESKSTTRQQQPNGPDRPPLTDAEREAIRQADEAFDWKTHNDIVNGTYSGPLPEHIVGNHWTELYPNIYHTKIAGINFRKGIKNLAGTYFDVRIEPEPKNKYDKNAIKILKADDGRHLGYIPADETEHVREFIKDDFTCHCRAFVEEGEEYDEELERDKTYLYGFINIYRPNISPSV